MYNSLTRLQNVFGFFTTVAFVVAAIIAASDFGVPRTPSADITATNVQVYVSPLFPQARLSFNRCPRPASQRSPFSVVNSKSCLANAAPLPNRVKGRPHYYSTKKEEYAIIKFSLDADLSSLFTWNTKQLFVYVTAEWDSPKNNNQSNSAVIWDTIITAPSSDHLANIGPATLKKLRKSAAGKPVDRSRGLLHLKNQKPKYQITHPGGKIAETDDVVLKVHYNVQPWVGLLTWNQGRDYGLWKAVSGGLSKAFSLPAIKKKDEKKV